MAGRSRRLDIQGLRALAVLVVVAFHAGLPVPGGFVGVDVFFVISGFVIASMLQREWKATGRIRFRAFCLRRFKRLTPALALMVGVTAIVSALVLSPLGAQQTVSETGVGAMFLAANGVIAGNTGSYFDAPAAANPLLHTWTLSVEEQFYLAFPAILALGWFLAPKKRAPSVCSADTSGGFVVDDQGLCENAAGVADGLHACVLSRQAVLAYAAQAFVETADEFLVADDENDVAAGVRVGAELAARA